MTKGVRTHKLLIEVQEIRKLPKLGIKMRLTENLKKVEDVNIFIQTHLSLS